MKNFRPWGWFETIQEGSTYKVKRLLVKVGHQLSLQRHNHRSESWTVVQGDGLLLCDDDWHYATPGKTLTIPCGSVHRARGGSSDLLIIEVQHGEILSEDDIERLEDDYGRSTSTATDL